MSLSNSVETDSSWEYGERDTLSPDPVDLDLYEPDKSQALQRRDASLQNTVFHDGGLWPDTAVSYGSYDISSPYNEQQSISAWQTQNTNARTDILSQEEIGSHRHSNPMLPCRKPPFDFVLTTSVPRRSEEGISEKRRKQNRNSQRAFRARERIRVQNLEEQLADLTYQYKELELAYRQLKTKRQNYLGRAEIKEEGGTA